MIATKHPKIIMNDDFIHSPKFDIPGVTGMPDLAPILAQMPKEQQHRFESAGEFIKRLAHRVQAWRETLPDDEQPCIYGLLPDGSAVTIISIAEDGHSSVIIDGLLDESPCMFITHQASLQILCFTQKLEKEEVPRTIGFHVGGEQIQA